MTIFELGAFGEFVGAIAVLATLIYLASELRQSNLIALRDSRIQLNSMKYDLNKLVIENPQFLTLTVKLKNSDHPELTVEEHEQASSWGSMQLQSWGNISASIEAGHLSDQVARIWINDAVGVIKQ